MWLRRAALRSLWCAISFMDLLAQAKYVFICDTFVPVSSGKTDKDTKVVQLCHYSGPFKKIGYATQADVPAYYTRNVFQNYDLVSVSSEMYVPLLTDAMLQKEGTVKALGVSRTDAFYDSAWVDSCREAFYRQYPEARNKKILLWAPTFRGKASCPEALNNRPILSLQDRLGDDWMILIRHHPHDDAVAQDEMFRSNCDVPTERLLPVVDMLITDYSTTVLDYLVFDKPFILYAPDLEEYTRTRGFFIDYRSITKNMTTDPAQLESLLMNAYQAWLDGDREDILRCKERFAAACDGKSTERIFDYLQKISTNR